MRAVLVGGLLTAGSGCAGYRFSDVELDVHDAINAYREERGLDPLELHPAIGAPCREHSQDMADGVVPPGHDGFDVRATAIQEQEPGFRSFGENVALNQGYADPVTVAVEGWLASDGHHDNIVGAWTHTGVGVAGDDASGWYFTQIFAHDGSGPTL